MKNTAYTFTQIALHWLSAVVIIWALVSGFSIAWLDPAESVKSWVNHVNVSLTTLLIPFFALRLFLAIRLAQPRAAAGGERLARVVHRLMYVLVTVVLVSGVLMMDRDINVFDVLIIPAPLADIRLITGFLQLHIWSCAALGMLVLLHVLAVIKHQLAGRRVLARMWS